MSNFLLQKALKYCYKILSFYKVIDISLGVLFYSSPCRSLDLFYITGPLPPTPSSVAIGNLVILLYIVDDLEN